MKSEFLQEIKRIDKKPSSEELFLIERQKRHEQIRNTQAGRLAFELDSPKNRFRNEHLWYLYRDGDDLVSDEDDLESCLAYLEFDNILSIEVDGLPETKAIHESDLTKFLRAHDKVHMDYRKKIVKQCYEQGRFETSNWKIEHNAVSSRFK